MAVVAGKNRVNRPYFFRDIDGDRVEFPSFGTGQGELEGNELRMFNMYVAARQIDATTASPPNPFVVGNWSAIATLDGISVTISALPANNGVDLTGIAIRIDGADVTIVAPATGSYLIPLDPGEYTVDIAAISDAGQSAWSDEKTVDFS